ncbi:MAG: hypothetical protein AB1941_05045 [Gemmatimonadota bacterium]
MTHQDVSDPPAAGSLRAALAGARSTALRAPGEWATTEDPGRQLALAWLVPAGPRPARVEHVSAQRAPVPPTSDDLVAIAGALPDALHVVDAWTEPGGILQLDVAPDPLPRASGPCGSCGRVRDLWTPAGHCAVCAARPAPGGRSPGDAGFTTPVALVALVLLSAIALAVHVLVVSTQAATDAGDASRLADRTALQALDVLTERFIGRAEEVLGDLTDADLAALTAGAATLPTLPGAALDPARTRVAATRILRGDAARVPAAPFALAAWTHQPLPGYDNAPVPAGALASRVIEVTLSATAVLPDGTARTAQQTLAVARVAPHQWALLTSPGVTHLCAEPGARVLVSGPVRAGGHLHFQACGGTVRYSGGIDARDGVTTDPDAGHFLLTTEGAYVPAEDGWALGTGPTVAPTQRYRHLRVDGAGPAPVPPDLFAGSARDGIGECGLAPDAPCGPGTVRSYAGVTVQRTLDGPATAYAVTCGPAYAVPDSCAAAVSGALRYHPWPFPDAGAPGRARPDPAAPSRLWQGLFPDVRRETRCTATVGGRSFRTFRCPTNAFGYVLDAGALPPVPGGLLRVLAATNATRALAAPHQEVLLVVNAQRLQAPLTIHSDLPIVLVGHYNSVAPRPAMLQAPRVHVLPVDALEQLRTAAVWDSVAPYGSAAATALPLVADRTVAVYGVVATRACGTEAAGRDYHFGGPLAQPATLGDWSRAGLALVGALEVYGDTGGYAACSLHGAAFDDALPGTAGNLPPAWRLIQHDPLLLTGAGTPPGSHSAANMPAPGDPRALPGRTAARQAHAVGGRTVVWVVRHKDVGTPRLPPPVSIP